MLPWRNTAIIIGILNDWKAKCSDHIFIWIEHKPSFRMIFHSRTFKFKILLLLDSYIIYSFIALYFYMLSHYIICLGGGIMLLYVHSHSSICGRGHAMKGRGEYYDLALVII